MAYEKSKHVDWRDQFLALAEDVYRELSFAPPSLGQDETLPLTIELNDEVQITHFPFQRQDQIVVEVYCSPLGSPPQESLERLLQLQHEFDPAKGLSFGLDDNANVLLNQCISLQGLRAERLLQRVKDMQQFTAALRTSDGWSLQAKRPALWHSSTPHERGSC